MLFIHSNEDNLSAKLISFVSTVFLILGLSSNAAIAQITLFDWNDPHAVGTNWPGWQWYPGGEGNDADDFGSPGWRKDDGQFMSGCCDNWFPRSHDKGNDDRHGGNCLAAIENGALKVYDVTLDGVNRASWWVLLNGRSFSEFGVDAGTNRMDFYIKLGGMRYQDPLNVSNYGFHVGTYLCWDGKCPKEGPGNQHYYHYFGFNPGAWIHAVMDRHPTHHRGNHLPPSDNEPYKLYGKHYFENMNSMYFEISGNQDSLSWYLLDDLRLYSTGEENDESITSIWVGYWKNSNYWEISFSDASFGDVGYNDASGSTFDIRYSPAPITNENFEQATPIEPLFHAVEGYPNLIWRHNNWKLVVWTRFRLPDELEHPGAMLYFAAKDVSVKGAHVGGWPHHLGDGHDAPSDLIHTIDYSIRPDSEPVTSVMSLQEDAEEQLGLTQNYPNPFNPNTIIRYYMPFIGEVTIRVFDTSGRFVAEIESGVRNVGDYKVKWNGRNSQGIVVANGVYYYRLKAVSPDGKSASVAQKMVILK